MNLKKLFQLKFINLSLIYLLFTLHSSLFTLQCSAQEYTLKAGFKDLPYSRIYLARLMGEKIKTIDSTKSDFSGGFQFKLKNGAPIGQYRLLTDNTDRKSRSDNGQKNIMDFIFNNEDIEFYTTVMNPAEDMQVVSSTENKLYFNYMIKRTENKNKLEMLSYLLANYPKTDDFYNLTAKKVESIEREEHEMIDNIISKQPRTFVSHMVGMDRNVEVDPKLNEDQKTEYLKAHYFDNCNFNDSLLINSTSITNKIIGYLTLYREKKNDRDKQEVDFIRAVDFIMKNTNKNKKVYEFILDYLITGFERFEFTKVLTYIADNSRIEESCQNEDNKTVLETKIDSYRKYSVGNTVPDISINDQDGKLVKLSGIKTDYVLLLFWASWCPHCEALIPEIKKVYENQKPGKLEILAVSIDDKKDDWLKAIAKQNLKWINTAELKGWDGKTIKDYCIYATPTLFLVDKNLKIVAKPLSIDELTKAIK